MIFAQQVIGGHEESKGGLLVCSIGVIDPETLSVAFGDQSGLVSHNFSILVSFTAKAYPEGIICASMVYHKVKGPQFFQLVKAPLRLRHASHLFRCR